MHYQLFLSSGLNTKLGLLRCIRKEGMRSYKTILNSKLLINIISRNTDVSKVAGITGNIFGCDE